MRDYQWGFFWISHFDSIAGRSNAMPPANVTWMEEDERTLLVQWYEEAL